MADNNLPLLPQLPVIVTPYFAGKWYWLSLLLLVVLVVADNVLVVVLFDTFGERYAQFLNQGTAFVYILWSSVILLYRQCCARTTTTNINVNATTTNINLNDDRDDKDEDKDKDSSDLFSGKLKLSKPTAPHWVLIGIGLFNGSGNFLMAISQPHTPGLTQTLLNLLGIPLVLIFSAVFLGKSSTKTEWCGAGLIVVGTCISGLRTVLQPAGASAGAPIVAYVGSCMFYASAQLFLSGEKVWEEWSFTSFHKLDPMVMFWYTLVTQFMLGWFLYPLQTIPAFGNISLAEIPEVIGGGVLCTFGNSSGGTSCNAFNTFIFFIYCSVDFWCYFFGLWVIQKGGANLMVITIAVALPLQQLVLCTKGLLGKWSERFFWGDSVALGLVLLGFLCYQYAHRQQFNDIYQNNNTDDSMISSSLEQRSKAARARINHAQVIARTKATARRMSSRSVARQTLKCEACEEIERGMCNDCRDLFKSDEWTKLHPEWKEKKEREKNSPTKYGW